ncbi:hypothetical protein PENTCL1PPCAC_20663, partial [Pristionchus entomophagus]
RVVQDHEAGSTILVFLGPCSLISEQVCRLCQALHVNLLQLSTIVLLLSFGFRLYILSGPIESHRSMAPSGAWIMCIASLTLMIPPIVSTLKRVPSRRKLYDDEIVLGRTSDYFIFGSTPALLLIVFIVILSPSVFTGIFVVRRRLLARIEDARPTEKRQHVSIARALTYQMLLPFGMAAATVLWLLDVNQI